MKSIRPLNLLMVALIQLLFWYFVIFAPFGENNLRFSFFGVSQFIWMLLASLFITASGNFINDYTDYDNDRLNGKSKGWEKSRLWRMFLATSLLGLVFAVLSAWSLSDYQLFFVYVIIWGLLYFYSKTYQRKILIGNIVVALLTAMLIGIMWLAVYLHLRPLILRPAMIMEKYVYISNISLVYMAFAFLLSLIRELVKDMEDRKGDEASGYRTFPVRYGPAKTKMLLHILSAVFVILLIVVMQWCLHFEDYYLVAASGLIFLLYAFFHTRMAAAKEEKDWHFLSLLLKIIMLLGVLSIPLVPWI